MRQFINMVRASLVVSLVLFVQSHNVYAVQELVVMCPAYEWQGQRVGFNDDASIENDKNGMFLKETVFMLGEQPLEVGATVPVMYGGDDLYYGKLRYVHNKGGLKYVIIETKPKDLLQVYAVDFHTGGTILTVTSQLFGFYVDTYTNTCKAVVVGLN